MNVKKFVLYLIVVFAISVFLVSCAVKTIGKPSVTSSPFPTATPLASATTSPPSSPSVTPSPPSSPSPSPTPEECKTDDDCHDDGWYDTDPLQTQWVNTETGNTIADQCTKKEQKKQEYRDYSCNSNSECEYSIDTSKGDNGYNWIDAGNTRCKPYGTGCVLPASTSPTPSPTVSASPSSSPISSPTPELTIEGFCKDCVCIEKNCENVYGIDYQNCGKDGAGLLCCRRTDLCCGKNDKTAICCDTNKYKCGSALSYNWCQGKNCEEQGKKTCTASFLPEIVKCCPLDTECGVDKGGIKDTPFCGYNNCNMKGYNPTPCYTDKKGIKMCCKLTESCVDVIDKDGGISGKKACSAKTCGKNEHKCTGKGTNSFMSICCKEGEICNYHPSGFPTCTLRG